ncbi:response regulator transcription factor [Microbacterium sp.]|uniref:helix-turn-helix transcriptional regulator n=1 Tax=Microbacterium sp. TaxID=51671 RepID=UPI002E2FED04|nr:response regulator transcription factor [Microbacterium sp.]HEX5730918.1 response regulator transcription factor [Microbacterium sp.]
MGALALPWNESSDTAADARARVVYAAGWANFELKTAGRGREQFVETLALQRRLGNTGEQAVCLRALSRIASEEGDHTTAERLARHSLSLCRRTGDVVGVGWSLSHLFGEAYEAGRMEEAERLLLDSISTFHRAGVAFGEEGLLIELGTLRRRRRQWAQALTAYADSLAIMRESGFTAEGSDLLHGLAAVAAELHAPARAARLFAAAETWAEIHGASSRYNIAIVEPTDHERELAHAALGGDGWARWFAAGAQLTSEQALAEAADTIAELATLVEAPLPAGLTAREVEVLRLLTEGLSNNDLAARLVVSPRTVHTHLRSIFGKLGVSSRTAAVHEAHRLGVRL